jgi:hypothetical protein
MDKKKALLIAAGGRALPDVLAMLYVQPQRIICITSNEGWSGERAFVEVAKDFPNCEDIELVRDVAAYNFEQGQQACLQVLATYPQTKWDWIFAISSAPKITAIATYEVAKQHNIPCLYIDTTHEKVVPLVRKLPATEELNIFHMDVPTYMRIQKRTAGSISPKVRQYRQQAEQYGEIARTLALSEQTPAFTAHMYNQEAGKEVEISDSLATSSLIQLLVEQGLVTLQKDKSITTCAFTTYHASQFLGKGDWLEIYVWNEVKKAHFADDCQWGYSIIDGRAENELDVVITYKAQLLIAECKTDANPFKGKKKYLDVLASKAQLLGGPYVSRIFITNQPETTDNYQSFQEQANKRQIVVFTSKDLPHIGQLLKEQAEKPTYPRI